MKETNHKSRFETCKHYLLSAERGVVSGELKNKNKHTNKKTPQQKQTTYTHTQY